MNGLGWIPNPDDRRDYDWERSPLFGVGRDDVEPSVEHLLPPRYRQYSVNCCITMAFLTDRQVARKRCGPIRGGPRGVPEWHPNIMQHYWNGRRQSGFHQIDVGGYPRDFSKAEQKRGVGREEDWPFDEANALTPPPAHLALRATSAAGMKYRWIGPSNRVEGIDQALRTARGVSIGLMVGDEWHNYRGIDRDGVLGVPRNLRTASGHMVYIVRHMGDGVMKIRNWWTWGEALISRKVVEHSTTRDLRVTTGW